MKSYLRVRSLVWSAPSFAQKLVDPSTMAPQYREAAEKRRAEQNRQRDCTRKAETEKVTPRDRTAFLLDCLRAAEAAKERSPRHPRRPHPCRANPVDGA